MSALIKFSSIAEYNQARGLRTYHPLITVFDLSQARRLQAASYLVSFYTIYYKEFHCGEIKYGRKSYDYQDGTLLFLSPGQIIGVPEQTDEKPPSGKALVFHPDLIKGTSLGKKIHEYSFFSYDVDEALHVSEREKAVVYDCMTNLEQEIGQPIDRHSKTLIASNIELLLNYCNRFYERQFITRELENKSVIEKFEALLHSYFNSERPATEGFPSVAFCARELHLSANYFGDLIKKETGMAPSEHIQAKAIDVAKEKIFDLNYNIADIAYALGFSYPQHFTRLFKLKTGSSPNEYRNKVVLKHVG